MDNQRTLLFLIVLTGTSALFFITRTARSNMQLELEQSVVEPDRLLDGIESTSRGRDVSKARSRFAHLQGQLTSTVAPFRKPPFEPEYGNEVFDNTRYLAGTEREKWKRHCRLRDVYASEQIRDSAFLELHELVNQFGLNDDMDTLCYLYDITYGLSISSQYATDYSPELISDTRQKELREFLDESIGRYKSILTDILGQEAKDGFIDALMQIHPTGGIGDPSTHIEPGERIILN